MPDSAVQPSDDQLFAELRKIDTPTITNVVATYPKNPLCLGLYNPWTENWYTDTSIRCIYPEMGADRRLRRDLRLRPARSELSPAGSPSWTWSTRSTR